MNNTTIHPPIFFDEDLGSFVVTDGDLIAEIFRSAKFDVVAYAEHYRAIAERTSLDLGACIHAMNHMPLANEGAAHKHLRIEAAAAIGFERRENAHLMDAFVTALIAHIFRDGAEIDLVKHLAIPVFGRVYSLWAGKDISGVAEEINVSQVFCGAMSLNRRREINAGLASLTAALTEAPGELRISPEVAVTIGILGSDSLVGSLSLSLWEEFSRHSGAAIDTIAFPENLPSTSVPYIDRVAVEDTEIGGMTIAKGQRLRLRLDATSMHVSGEEQDLLFGKGRHLCVGKPMTSAIWRIVVQALSRIPYRVTPLEMRLRPRDYVFSYPEYARIRLHA